jgi:hypothetical protein
MKARKVKGIDVDGPLGREARKIVMVRLDELYSFSPAVYDPAEMKALHDMRIAAKRLRYVLETTDPAFGAVATRGAKAARHLQDLLGEIHDCDEMLPRIRRHVEKLRAEDAASVRDAAGPEAEDLEPAAAKEAPNRTAYRGLEALAVYTAARRDVLYARFLREWRQLDEKGFRQKLEKGLVPRRRAQANGRPQADGKARGTRARAKAGAT